MTLKQNLLTLGFAAAASLSGIVDETLHAVGIGHGVSARAGLLTFTGLDSSNSATSGTIELDVVTRSANGASHANSGGFFFSITGVRFTYDNNIVVESTSVGNSDIDTIIEHPSSSFFRFFASEIVYLPMTGLSILDLEVNLRSTDTSRFIGIAPDVLSDALLEAVATAVNFYVFDVSYQMTSAINGTTDKTLDVISASYDPNGSIASTASSSQTVPEPAALGLFGTSLIGLALLRRRRRRT